MDRAAVEQLVEQITREVVAVLRTEQDSSICAMDASGVCLSCELCVEKCPERVQELVTAGASRVSSSPGVHGVTGALAAMIDHTILKADATTEQLTILCDEAKQYNFATVCVNPANVAFCAQALQGTPVKICSVVGFPLGATTPEAKAFEAERAIRDGATEIDMVINVGALKSKDYDLVLRDISAVTQACHKAGAHCKVIIEAAMLTDEEKVIACTLVKQAGADFVKTSTGFGPGGATLADVALMRRVVGEEMGVKAAGGIRSFRDAAGMIAAGATRIGASAGVRIVQEAKQSQ
jgi:deoxyribose-phosphate aldolase